MSLIALPSPADWTLDAGLATVALGGIRLTTELFSDIFTGTTIDTAKWDETDSGSNISQNNRLEGKGNAAAWDANMLKSDNSFALPGMELKFKVETGGTTGHYIFGLGATAFAVNSASLYFVSGGGFTAVINGGTTATGYNWLVNKTYNVRIVYQSPGWKLYVQSPNDTYYTGEVQIYSTATATTGPLPINLNFFSTTTYYVDDVYVYSGYPTDGRVAETPWIAIDQNTLDATIPINIIVNQIATLQGFSSFTAHKFKWAANNGSYNDDWITHAALVTALQGIAITNHTNSLRIKVQFNSNGSQPSDISGFGSYGKAGGAAGGGNIYCLID